MKNGAHAGFQIAFRPWRHRTNIKLQNPKTLNTLNFENPKLLIDRVVQMGMPDDRAGLPAGLSRPDRAVVAG